ncbi:sulfotransferase [Leptolyngbya sp. CCNP1308]|uniref:sulfotransferase n=1 Tax=Leptolyngbya sp. CCNP1308 TaxID=3110255 RepID=UPI002B21B470|nr:sulfotransferase [Leptolyngbya sp. CCNP1308]MEA5452273.1 sulfotransferase [Leptolyngbya sp. CCNP1308]
MKNSSVKPILVTGSHRSGTTWTGKMIANSKQVHYIHEPFNIDKTLGFGCCRANFPYWYTHVHSENEDLYYAALKDTVNFRYSFLSVVKQLQSPPQIKTVLKDYIQFEKSKALRLRPLLKDPLALFSAEWLSSSFNTDVLILIRHPAAFVSSIKRKQWAFPFEHFLRQKTLLEKLPEHLQSDVRAYAQTPHDIILQASLLWNICHSKISDYVIHHPDWMFVKHEALSLEPAKEFQRIFLKLNLKFTPQIKSEILNYSSPDNLEEAPNQSFDYIKLDSRRNIKNWKQRLTQNEIFTVRSQVESISHEFYGDEDW